MPSQPDMKVRTWRELMHVHALVTNAIDAVLRSEVGISADWYEALVEIAFAGGTMRMNEFADETTLTKSGATRFVDRLEKAGLVERIRCPEDRRAWQLRLTEEGERIQRLAGPHVLAAVEEHFGRHISDEEAELMGRALSRARSQPLEV